MTKKAEQYPNYTERSGPVVVKRDGQAVSEVLADANTAFAWLLRYQGQSVSYALKYGGFSVEPATMTEED